MIPLESFTKKFFEQNHSLLSANYPGISSHRLIRELKELSEDMKGSHFHNLPFSQTNIFFESLVKGIPLEYIGKKCYFFRSYFEMQENVFIPRSETELLVEYAVKELYSQHEKLHLAPIKVLDVGTGSGNILLSIAQEYPDALEATGVDISEDALNLAKRNAFLLQYTFSKNKTFHFLKSDRLSSISQQFHLIVSNPPYIKQTSDRKNVHPQVARYEPSQALYLEDKSYQDWFEEFFIQVKSSLLEGGAFLMEGHEDHLEELKQIATNINGFYSAKIENDLSAKNRYLILRT